MTIHLLGTGGADGIPAFYGDSRVSAYAREHRGKDLRTRAAALVDGCLKLDLGPDTWHQVTRDGLDARDWTAVLYTHSDADHFAVDELQYALFPFNDMEFVGFTIYANAVICRRILERYPDWPFELVMTESFRPIEHGGYVITPIHANHSLNEDAHNFIIDDGTKKLLYATDTGVWGDPTWQFLKGFVLDGLVIECSEGRNPTPYFGHLDIESCLGVIGRLRNEGILSASAKIITTHHADSGDCTHAELEEAFAPHDISVGYDGLIVTL